jgi:hypothetical protein
MLNMFFNTIVNEVKISNHTQTIHKVYTKYTQSIHQVYTKYTIRLILTVYFTNYEAKLVPGLTIRF